MSRAAMNLTAIAVAVIATACASVPFERYVSQERWSDAAAAFDSDTALLNNERALFDAGIMYSSPARGVYNPDRARALFQRLLARFPSSGHRLEATDRLALLDTIVAERTRAAARVREVEARIAALVADSVRLRLQVDSLTVAKVGADRNLARVEADLRDRDEQLRQLRLELARLKEIDLKPRRPDV